MLLLSLFDQSSASAVPTPTLVSWLNCLTFSEKLQFRKSFFSARSTYSYFNMLKLLNCSHFQNSGVMIRFFCCKPDFCLAYNLFLVPLDTKSQRSLCYGADCWFDKLQIKFFHETSSMVSPVTDAEKLIWMVLEEERPTIRLQIMSISTKFILLLS